MAAYAGHLLDAHPTLSQREYEALCYQRWQDCDQSGYEWTWEECLANPVRDGWERFERGKPVASVSKLRFVEAGGESAAPNDDAEPGDDAGPDDEASSWRPVDIGPVLDGSFERVKASIGYRSDGQALLYPGKEHTVMGEPESAKSWLELYIARCVLERGGKVLWIDFEDDETTIVGRLHFELGVDAEVLRERFHFMRPETQVDPDVYGEVLDSIAPDVVFFDGTTEGYGLHGWKIADNDDAPKWRLALIKPALRRGIATMSTDHVVKNKEARNGYQIGGQHKKAGLTGVLFELVNVKPFGKGLLGHSRLLIHKDRNGDLRQHGVPDPDNPRVNHFADLYLNAAGDKLKLNDQAKLGLELRPPTVVEATGKAPDRIDGLTVKILECLKQHGGTFATRTQLEDWLRGDGVEFRTKDFGGAVERLTRQGRLETVPGRGGSKGGRLTGFARVEAEGFSRVAAEGKPHLSEGTSSSPKGGEEGKGPLALPGKAGKSRE
jgi:hypothetical protein